MTGHVVSSKSLTAMNVQKQRFPASGSNTIAEVDQETYRSPLPWLFAYYTLAGPTIQSAPLGDPHSFDFELEADTVVGNVALTDTAISPLASVYQVF